MRFSDLNHRFLLTALMMIVVFVLPMLAMAQNNPPIVDAGEDQSIFVGGYTTLQGSATDPDGHAIASYLWTIESAPSGSTPILSDDGNPNSTFTADVAGDYILSLVATDGILY